MVIVWSKPAREDLRLIFNYIANDSPRYATRVIQDIVDKVGTLAEFPNMGRVVPEIDEVNVREIGMYSYRIMYEVIDDMVKVHGVVHKRRHFKAETLSR